MQCWQWFYCSLSLVSNGSVGQWRGGTREDIPLCEPVKGKSFTPWDCPSLLCSCCILKKRLFRLVKYKLLFCLCLGAHGLLRAGVQRWKGQSEHPVAPVGLSEHPLAWLKQSRHPPAQPGWKCFAAGCASVAMERLKAHIWGRQPWLQGAWRFVCLWC